MIIENGRMTNSESNELKHTESHVQSVAAYYDLKLWCDLKNDKERIEFMKCGRAGLSGTGIFADVVIEDLIEVYEFRAKKEAKNKGTAKAGADSSQFNAIYDASYAMQEAYQTETNMYTAIDKVQSKYPDMDEIYLKIMWRAIDAYVDLNAAANPVNALIILRSEACHRLNKLSPDWPCVESDLMMYSWPQTFGSTAGPRGCGGQMMSSFNVFMFVSPTNEAAVECCSVWRMLRKGEFEPMRHVKF